MLEKEAKIHGAASAQADVSDDELDIDLPDSSSEQDSRMPPLVSWRYYCSVSFCFIIDLSFLFLLSILFFAMYMGTVCLQGVSYWFSFLVFSIDLFMSDIFSRFFVYVSLFLLVC